MSGFFGKWCKPQRDSKSFMYEITAFSGRARSESVSPIGYLFIYFAKNHSKSIVRDQKSYTLLTLCRVKPHPFSHLLSIGEILFINFLTGAIKILVC